jgi:hypothetical protein
MESQGSRWDLDNEDIASIESEELYRSRPNRWSGAKSTWRTLTEEETLLWRSMKQIDNQNLSIHLYNAFALKKRRRDPETAVDLMVQTVSSHVQ